MVVFFMRFLMTLEFWLPMGARTRWWNPDFDIELVSGDFSDAYFHFRVHPDAWKHCLSPDLVLGWVLLWVHMCFGLRAAPLVWCRFAAAVPRLLAGMFETHELLFQLYLDDRS